MTQQQIHPALRKLLAKQRALVGTYSGLASLIDDIGDELVKLNTILYKTDENSRKLMERIKELEKNQKPKTKSKKDKA